MSLVSRDRLYVCFGWVHTESLSQATSLALLCFDKPNIEIDCHVGLMLKHLIKPYFELSLNLHCPFCQKVVGHISAK